MTAISFSDVTKRFDGAPQNAVNHLSFDVKEGEFITIVGTSGCGKTTILKMINRLYERDGGVIRFFEEDISQKDPVKLRLGMGYVIQQIGLFPHMTVFENVAVVLRILKWDKVRVAARVKELLQLVNLDPDEFQGRHPSMLSGGQQQRIGLARALAADPAVLLMDEPFGAIDAINRTNLQNELLSIHRKQNRTCLFVTHDISEAFKLGQRVLIMDKGDVQQFDTPENIVKKPASTFVRELLVSSGVLSAFICDGDGI
jgi:osmoprotectant transport system ATP-binding protein